MALIADTAAPRIVRILRFGLVSQAAARLAAFYEAAFGCHSAGEAWLTSAEMERRTGIPGGAFRRRLQLGGESIDLLEFDRPGATYPPDSSPADPVFQHLALVVGDMRRAFARLQGVPGWAPISSHGPQRLPAASGGVTAFKFRDPEGHPLELLEFPADRIPTRWHGRLAGDTVSGIDHSAVSVADTDRSVSFYAAFGFKLTARQLNQGEEQSRLDGMEGARVEVTALATPAGSPHLELLTYDRTGRQDRLPGGRRPQSHDTAATWLTLEADRALPELLQDPDGHRLEIVVGPS